jgi:hypothetical protein
MTEFSEKKIPIQAVTRPVHSLSRLKFCFVRAREKFFDESFTRVTGLIFQVRRGKANFFLTFFMQNLPYGEFWISQLSPFFLS